MCLTVLETNLLASIVLALNDGPIPNSSEIKRCFLYPGRVSGRELHYFQITRDAMVFMKCVCRYFRHDYAFNQAVHWRLFTDHTPCIETWSPIDATRHIDYTDWKQICTHVEPYAEQPVESEEKDEFVPRHIYAGRADGWMAIRSGGPQ